mmetsp:Transcript_137035/g.238237  ORF Transcript_137035/g.238237 Transcript_137035/m.238237 type:complete len:222 (-) Transcript_137035:11002-11667(-)
MRVSCLAINKASCKRSTVRCGVSNHELNLDFTRISNPWSGATNNILCNFCGSLCQNLWHNRSPVQTDGLASPISLSLVPPTVSCNVRYAEPTCFSSITQSPMYLMHFDARSISLGLGVHGGGSAPASSIAAAGSALLSGLFMLSIRSLAALAPCTFNLARRVHSSRVCEIRRDRRGASLSSKISSFSGDAVGLPELDEPRIASRAENRSSKATSKSFHARR